ncbi:cytochrome C peroxidase [Scytonema hofmannii PCC 7110]|uniref:Cytochrome C peroxidase n=1 Tax=Scytonema hofmannii PCC 7110 TaxID=128403 RepID=A0A139WVC5_9CYAN|nr:cytochrome c peroxidase [Scytonema hofmannii]KYC36374.1 cytochrome C peroxidase [Scytonema hofmannii PCC 7110]
MNNGWNKKFSSLPELETSEQKNFRWERVRNATAQFFHQIVLSLLEKIQALSLLVTTITVKLGQISLKLPRRMKKGMTIAVIITATVLAGHTASAQFQPPPAPPALTTVKVPEPDNLGDFVKNKVAAIKLGKTLFWDMQIGSDGITACASCHFHAGADSRSKNQLSPGLLRVSNLDLQTPNPDTKVELGGMNYQLKPEDYPFHKLQDPNKSDSTVLADTNDVTSSQGVFYSKFVDAVPGSAEDKVEYKPDPDGFTVGNTNVRRVEPRNTPTVINAVFNFRNFWDGRAQDIFNGVNPFGLRDPDAKVYKVNNKKDLEAVTVRLKNSSLASQAVGPIISSFEMSADGRTSAEIGDKLGSFNRRGLLHIINDKSGKFPRRLGKRLLPLRPLGKQLVDPNDSVLGDESRGSLPGLRTRTYTEMIQAAFKDEWWNSKKDMIQVGADGKPTVVRKPDRNLTTQEYTLTEYNFPLLFGLAVQMYESTLISDDAPYDRFQQGNNSALTAQQKAGLEVFRSKGLCIFCHNGAEFTNASVSNVSTNGRLSRAPDGRIEDTGFFRIGVRPPFEDLGAGANDPFGNSLSEARLAEQGKFQQIFGEAPNRAITSVIADGAFKSPGLRNVELTAPYFHNGGQRTLREVIDFYNRGGDFRGTDSGNLPPLNLTEEEKESLVAFLKGLTDERVRYQKAPFDHPQLFVTNGHPGNETYVTDDGTGKATDGTLLEIPAVGRNGSVSPLPNFLE